MKKTILWMLVCILLAMPVFAQEGWILYDDFSDSSIDTTKWATNWTTESSFDEGVNTLNTTYTEKFIDPGEGFIYSTQNHTRWYVRYKSTSGGDIVSNIMMGKTLGTVYGQSWTRGFNDGIGYATYSTMYRLTNASYGGATLAVNPVNTYRDFIFNNTDKFSIQVENITRWEIGSWYPNQPLSIGFGGGNRGAQERDSIVTYVYYWGNTALPKTISWVNFSGINGSLENVGYRELWLNLSNHNPLVNISIYNGSNLYTNLLNHNSSDFAKINVTTESQYILKANTTVQTKDLYYKIDRTNGTINVSLDVDATLFSWVGDTISLNVTCEDDNLYGCNTTMHDSFGQTRYFNETIMINTTSHTFGFSTTTNATGQWTLDSCVSDDHTANKIYIDARVSGKMLVFNDEVWLQDTNIGATTPKYTKLSDRYTFDFGTRSALTRTYEIQSTLPILYLEDSQYKGHFVVGNGIGSYWIDFENTLSDPITVTKSRDGYLIQTRATEFQSIGGVNLLCQQDTLTVQPVMTNITSTSDLDLSGLCYDGGTGIANVTINDTSYSNAGNATNWNFQINQTPTEQTTKSLTLTCTNNAGYTNTTTTTLTYTPQSQIELSWGVFDTQTCILTQDLAYVFGFFMLVIMLILGIIANEIALQIPIFNIFAGFCIFALSISIHVCSTIYAMPFWLIGLFIMAKDLIYLLKN